MGKESCGPTDTTTEHLFSQGDLRPILCCLPKRLQLTPIGCQPDELHTLEVNLVRSGITAMDSGYGLLSSTGIPKRHVSGGEPEAVYLHPNRRM